MITLTGKDLWTCSIKDGLAYSTLLGCMSLLGKDSGCRSWRESVPAFSNSCSVTAAFSHVQTARSPCFYSSLPPMCKGIFWCLLPVTLVVAEELQTATDRSQLVYAGCWCWFHSLWPHSSYPLWFTTVWLFTLALVIGHVYQSQLMMVFV